MPRRSAGPGIAVKRLVRSAMVAQASLSATLNPTIPATFSVPARRPRSCAPPVDQIGKRDAFADKQRAHAFRPVEFVRGERKQVDVLLLDVDRQCAGRLYSIGVEQNAVLLADGADFRNRADSCRFRCSHT